LSKDSANDKPFSGNSMVKQIFQRIIGLLDFVHLPGFKKLEHNIKKTGSVSILRKIPTLLGPLELTSITGKFLSCNRI
jgi:hypothetical protein